MLAKLEEYKRKHIQLSHRLLQVRDVVKGRVIRPNFSPCEGEGGSDFIGTNRKCDINRKGGGL